MRQDDKTKGGDQMSDQEQNLKAGAAATMKPKSGTTGIWSFREKGVAA